MSEDSSKRMAVALMPAAQKAHDLNLWLLPTAAKFPRMYKFTLGDRIQTSALDLELALIEAGHARSKERALFRASRLLDQLRLLLRLAVELEVLSNRQHRFVADTMDELGRMIGGWMRANSQRRGGEPNR